MAKRILVILHPDLIPPEQVDEKSPDHDYQPWACEYDVIQALKKLKYRVEVLGVDDDLRLIRDKVESFKPHLVFNLLEQFAGETVFDQNVVSYLELLRVPYTGCNPRGLMIARNKALAKKILRYHRIATPAFHTFYYQRKIKVPKDLSYPFIVKCLREEASLGLSRASVVNSEEKLYERVRYLFDTYKTDVIAERFIEGREFTCGVIGNNRLEVFPPSELVFSKVDKPEKELYTERTKWSRKVRERKGVEVVSAKLSAEQISKMQDISKRAYRNLEIDGVARMDFRMDSEGRLFLIEANPNPNLARGDELAMSAEAKGISYPELIKKIVSHGLKR
jgi:D-alanine-D-alanine ligase